MTNAAEKTQAGPFHFDTAGSSCGFVAQALAQALHIPKLTALEGARSYAPAEPARRRLVRYA